MRKFSFFVWVLRIAFWFDVGKGIVGGFVTPSLFTPEVTPSLLTPKVTPSLPPLLTFQVTL